jgi:predicted alpha-1,6-mannanase (GH76 family)
MTGFKRLLVCLVLALGTGGAAFAFTADDGDTIFNAYNSAFYVANNGNAYYKTDTGNGTGPGWWTFAEEIEMAEDAYVNSPTTARKNIVTGLCNGFVLNHGGLWTGDVYNDDISWAVIAFSRAYLITANTTFRDIAKNNFDAMYSRAWDTNFTGGGLWWRIDKQYKNAAVNGPAAIGACLLYEIYGDVSYLSKAEGCYAWERRVLFNANSGAIEDGIDTNNVYNTWASTYNQGTFIGVANFLHRATGLPFYYQDAILAAKYTQNSISSAGILPVYNSGDLGGFNGIFARWMARMAKDQNLWFAYGPWLKNNANAAWNFRNTNNLSWYNWTAPTPAGTNVLDSWDCSDSVVIMQVADSDPSDALQITPSAGFTAAAQFSKPANAASINLMLTNSGATALHWSLASTSLWLNVSADGGTLLPAAPATSVTVSVVPSATTNLPAGRYYTSIWLTNLTSGAVASRSFTLVISGENAPIAMTGYNAVMLAPNSATAGTPSATAFDFPNNYCFYQAGLNSSTRGLPPDGVFTSQLDGTTVFQLQPYGSTNALVLGYNFPGSATLTLTTPQAYNSLAILACSANGGGTGTFVLNFTNGTHSQIFTFNAQDWFNTSANVAIQGMGRLKLGAGFNAEDNGAANPNLYQTTFNLAALGLNEPIASITFTKPANSGSQQDCGVFAVSGVVAYREPVITQQPAPVNLFRFVGASNTWSVAANAALPVYYYWCQNGTVIPVATNSTYQLDNLQITNSGDYTVVISNAFGAVTSSIVSLTVVSAPTYPFGQAVLADDALGYWRLDETSGPVAHDYLAGNNGSYTPTVLLGQPGDNLLDTHKAARFGFLAAVNSCVTNIAMDFGTGGNAAFSVEAWVNGGSQTSDAGLVTKGYGNGGEQFNLDCGGGNHAFRFFVRDAAGDAHLATSSVVPNNQWHHLVGICDEADGFVRLYVDGVNVAQGTITPNSGLLGSALPMSIGSRRSGTAPAYDNQFAGYMEEVAVYGYAMSSTQVQRHYQAATNRAPAFFSNPFTVASANAGQSYSATLAGSASDPNGDIITFAKVSGPAWLTVAGNGSLGGTPFSGNVGTNVFVVSATDPSGLSSTATMNVMVLAAPPIVVGAVLQGNDLMLNWAGGIAPYQVQWTTNLLNPNWQDLAEPISTSNLLVSPTNGTAFYRIRGQ